MGIHWGAQKQSAVADSTAVAELSAMHTALKGDGLPIADLCEFLLGRPVEMQVMEDNTSAISTALAGYSPKLRYLHRSRRIDMEWLGDVFQDERHSLIHAASETQKADILTKEFGKADFEDKKRIIGLGAAAAESDRSLEPGVNCWVVDTGSGHHLVPRSARTPAETRSTREGTTLSLATANGTVNENEVTKSQVDALGMAVEVRVLRETPRVLSVFKLVQEGATFLWSPQGCWLTFKGQRSKLPIKAGVPLLRAGNAVEENEAKTAGRGGV